MALKELFALCALFTFTMAQLPVCGNSGRQCIDGVSDCVGDTCVCRNPPFVFGDGFFMCYRRNTVASESRNDPSLRNFNNETEDFPYPCRYLLTHLKQELKGRKRVVIGKCEFKIFAFNKRSAGKIFTHGLDIAVRVQYNNGSTVERSVRKFGTASAGVNDFTVDGVHTFVPNGPWVPSVDILYKDAPNKVYIKCTEDPANNQMVFDFRACGMRVTFVPYDVVNTRQQAQIPGASIGVNCAHHPVWLSNNKVIGLAPTFQGGLSVSDIVLPGLTPSQSLVNRAFTIGVPQNQPYASPSCSTAGTALDACNDADRTSAYNSCFWMLTEPKFIKCVSNNGLDFVNLFSRCVASWCQGTGQCPGVVSDISICGHISAQIADLSQFLTGASCP